MFLTLCLKTLGLYLYTLIISHNFCKLLSILNNLTLQEDLQNCVTNSVFMDKNKNTTKKTTENQT